MFAFQVNLNSAVLAAEDTPKHAVDPALHARRLEAAYNERMAADAGILSAVLTGRGADVERRNKLTAE